VAVKPTPADPGVDRFLVLRSWLAGLGVCWKCQSTLAFVQAERETSGVVVTAVLECATPERCRDRANAGRKTMPR